MKEFKITKEKILAMASECSEANAVLKKGFPEAFEEEEWKEISLDIMRLQRREQNTKEVGVVIPPEDFFMTYNVGFIDNWGGDRLDGNPATDLYVYKLKNGRVYRRKR